MTAAPSTYRTRDGLPVEAVMACLLDFGPAEQLAGGDVGQGPGGGLVIATRNGGLPIRDGDYVVKAADGTITVQDPVTFAAQHTPVPRYTPDEFAERARQAFAPPVQSRDVDAQPRFRNDSPRWTDWGYPR